MPALIPICIVIVTIGLLVSALVVMIRLNRAAEELSRMTRAVCDSAVKFDLVAQETLALVASLRDCVPPVQRVVDRFEAVGQRTADLSSALLEGLELPVFTAAAVTRGVRSGANHFLTRLMHRFTHRHSTIHGGYDHE